VDRHLLVDSFINVVCALIIRPPDIVVLVGRLRFYRDSILSSIFFFFFRQLSSELAEQNSIKTGDMLGSKCDLKMYV